MLIYVLFQYSFIVGSFSNKQKLLSHHWCTNFNIVVIINIIIDQTIDQIQMEIFLIISWSE